jgi:hypothetical protein
VAAAQRELEGAMRYSAELRDQSKGELENALRDAEEAAPAPPAAAGRRACSRRSRASPPRSYSGAGTGPRTGPRGRPRRPRAIPSGSPALGWCLHDAFDRRARPRIRAGPPQPGRSVSRAWWITGDDTETDATASALLVTTAPTTDTDSGLPLVELKIRDVGRYQWKGFATYSSPTRSGGPVVNAIGEVAKAYSASARPERIFQSLSTVNRYVAAGADPAADYGGAINVRDREVEGADRLVPTGEFRETHLYDAGSAGDAFFATLESTVGYVNSATFRSRAAGELLFVGFNAQPQGGGTFEVEFVFATSANVTGLTFGPITGISKNGTICCGLNTRTPRTLINSSGRRGPSTSSASIRGPTSRPRSGSRGRP